MHAAAVNPTTVNGMASAPFTNRTIYAAAETRDGDNLIPGMLLFGPQHKVNRHTRKRKRDEERRGSFPKVVPWTSVSKTATARKLPNVGYTSSTPQRLINADTGDDVPDDDLQQGDSVPTQSKTHLFGVWNSETKSRGSERDRVASVAVSGVTALAVETQFADPTIGLRVGFTRDSGIPQAFLSMPSAAEAFGTIIGPSKPILNSAEYERIGFAKPKMVPVLLHIREAAEAPKPADLVARFSASVLRALGPITDDRMDRLSRVLNKPHLVISASDAGSTPPSTDPGVLNLARNVVDELLKDAIVSKDLKTAAERLIELFIQLQDDIEDDFQWYKLARLPLGWETLSPDLFQYDSLAEGDYVCMGLTALRLWMTRDPVSI